MLRLMMVALVGLLANPVARAAEEIVFIAPTNHAMPLEGFADGQLTGGVLKDLGDAIAQRLGRQARYIAVPSKRVSMVLERGDADCLCYARPIWLAGEFDWSRPFLTDGGVVMARADAPRINTLNDLGGQRVGTVSGYRYQEAVDALGDQFIRDDGPTVEHSLQKLMAGRSRYAIIEELMAAYHLRTHPGHKLRIDFAFVKFQAQCAFSRRAHLPFAQMNHALDSLIDDGSVDAILARYR